MLTAYSVSRNKTRLMSIVGSPQGGFMNQTITYGLAMALALVLSAPGTAESKGGSRSSGTHSSSSHGSHPSGGSHYSGGSHSGSGSHASGSSFSSTGSQSSAGTHAGSPHGSNQAVPGVQRDSHGRIARSEKAKDDFKKVHPCPSTGKSSGRCPGYVIDHVTPLKRGGADAPSNMQWQTVEAAKIKDKTE